MHMIARLPAFLIGIAAVLAGNAALGQAGVQPSVTPAAIEVCVDAAGVMRLAELAVPCSPGEQRVRLKGPEAEPECEPLPPRELTELAKRVAELEGRGGDLLPSPVREPFEVVNEAGVGVFLIRQNPASPHVIGTRIQNEVGMEVAVIAANPSGGAVTLRDPSGTAGRADRVSTGIEAHGPYLALTTSVSTDRRIELGRRENGRFGLSVSGANEKLLAFLGESLARSGLVTIADTAGVRRVSMYRDSATTSGVVRILNAQEGDVAALSAHGHAGSGLLQLRNTGGEVMVEAGTLSTGVGAVRAGPAAFNHGIMFLGLPASYIVGKPQ